MALKKGYKQTEVGLLPEDWQTRKLLDCVRGDSPICYGILMPGEHTPNGVPVIKVRDIADGKISQDQLLLTHPKIESAYARSRLLAGDLLITIRGTTGRVAIVPRSLNNSNITQDTARIRTKKNTSVSFLYFILQCPAVQKQIALHTVGQAVKGINIRDVKRIEFPLPPTIAEQESIAGALSDADAWIESLEQLVAKKRQIKQATMQQLLTGKTRLPGLEGEWERKRFGDLFDFLRNASNSRADLTETGDVAYVHYGDIHTNTSAFLTLTSLRTYIDRDKIKNASRLVDGDLLMADASEDTAAIGKAVEISGVWGREAVGGLHTIVLRGDRRCLADGFKGYLQFIPEVRNALVRMATGVSVYGITRSGVKAIEVAIPPFQEQQAIALMLSDMDTEIGAIEAKLEKARQIKQGMMQELLTGRTRLV